MHIIAHSSNPCRCSSRSGSRCSSCRPPLRPFPPRSDLWASGRCARSPACLPAHVHMREYAYTRKPVHPSKEPATAAVRTCAWTRVLPRAQAYVQACAQAGQPWVISYAEFWSACPDPSQLATYTHVIAGAHAHTYAHVCTQVSAHVCSHVRTRGPTRMSERSIRQPVSARARPRPARALQHRLHDAPGALSGAHNICCDSASAHISACG